MAQNVLAVVAGHEITEEELQAFIGHLPKEQQAYAANPQFKEHCKEQLITFHALAKCGEDEKLEETEEFKKGMESARQDILVQMVLKETIESVSVSDDEVKDYFEQNKAQFVKGATVSAKHILTDSEEKCAAILETIVNGEKTFEEAARESSTCPSGAQGGDLGEFGKGQMVKEFEDSSLQCRTGTCRRTGKNTVWLSPDQSREEKRSQRSRIRRSERSDPHRTPEKKTGSGISGESQRTERKIRAEIIRKLLELYHFFFIKILYNKLYLTANVEMTEKRQGKTNEK